MREATAGQSARYVVVRIARYLRPYRSRFFLAFGLTFAISLLELAKPWPLKLVVDDVLGNVAGPAARPFGMSRYGLLVGVSMGFLALHLASALLTVRFNRDTIALGQRMVNDLRAELGSHLHGLSPGFVGRRQTTDLVYRVAFDTFAVQSILMNAVFPLVTALLLLTGMLLVVVRLNLVLACVFFSVLPILFVVVRGLSRRMSGLSTSTRETESLFLSETQRDLAAIHVVQAFTAERAEHDRVMQASTNALRSALRLHVFETGYSGVVSVVTALGTAIVLLVGGGLGLRGQLSAGDLVVFVSYLASVYAPIYSITSTIGLVQAGAAGAHRVFEILDEVPDVRNAADARRLAVVDGRLAVDHVSFSYAQGGFALRDVSLEIQPGTMCAIVGPTGAGKTTLASLIPRFFDPQVGHVRLDGVDLRMLELEFLRRQIGIVPQAPVLFPASLADNIRYGSPVASLAEVERAGEVAGVAEFVGGLSEGYATIIGPGGQTLSQGQMQRVGIARALLRDPKILILDEPTSALDTETEAHVMAGIMRATRGRTTIVIAHRLSTVQRADVVAVLEHGRLVEVGDYQTLMHAGGVFQRLHDAQLLVAPLAAARVSRT